jgi:hypothetical protein
MLCTLSVQGLQWTTFLELAVYLEREIESKKWSQFRVNRADKNNKKGLEPTSNSSFNFRHLGKECAEEISSI